MSSPAKGPCLLDLINSNPKSGLTFQSNPSQHPKESNNIFTSNIPVNNLFSPGTNGNLERK